MSDLLVSVPIQKLPADLCDDSYCDAAATFVARKTHLARYGFQCGCELCQRDREVHPVAARKLQERCEQILADVPSQNALLEIIEQLKATYMQEPNLPVYSMYRCFRALSEQYSRNKAGSTLIISAERSALTALGAKLHDLRKIPGTHIGQTNFASDPLIAMQDAIISCLKLAHEYFILGKDECAE